MLASKSSQRIETNLFKLLTQQRNSDGWDGRINLSSVMESLGKESRSVRRPSLLDRCNPSVSASKKSWEANWEGGRAKLTVQLGDIFRRCWCCTKIKPVTHMTAAICVWRGERDKGKEAQRQAHKDNQLDETTREEETIEVPRPFGFLNEGSYARRSVTRFQLADKRRWLRCNRLHALMSYMRSVLSQPVWPIAPHLPIGCTSSDQCTTGSPLAFLIQLCHTIVKL